jgi:NitT/TauT family transport system substrate-binding protein
LIPRVCLTAFVRFVATGLFIASLGAGGRGSVSAADTDLRIITAPFDVSIGVQYAQDRGFFKKYGLDAQIQYVINGEAAAAAIVGGSAEIGIANSISFAIAHEKGVELEFIAPGAVYADTNPTTTLVVANSSDIRAAKDLAGKTIALPAVSGLPPISVTAWLDKNGVDPKSAKFIEMPIAQMGVAVHNHVVDAALIAEPGLTSALIQQDVRILSLPFGAIAPRFYINGWYARKDWIAAHRDIAKRFARAVIEAQLWANQHTDDSGKILMSVAKIDPDLLRKMRRATFTGAFDPKLLQPVIDVAARYHALTKAFPAKDLYEQSL